ncbi:hypothetical protein SODALDRAFT_327195 [Sodiomyces alkalinus F11]|uniref:Uncharacterized protein n=1 Tax=Sodiomyces alkalinus (strain CBS 110278 / VKM F-3762 / F11) TaxID=1314773 RepID=A0A3N2Q8B8_SODAK|nr:hypothetical protein SODALDRAFT_327195 [Sodiomyces alkalinus F11]ROT43021.1 hypothetical protein SODALDRAFT_327195 [Sodiomyces alkalinus F11]
MAGRSSDPPRTDDGLHDVRDLGQRQLPRVRIKVETTNVAGETWSCDISFENPQPVHNDLIQELRSLTTKLLKMETIRNIKRVAIVEDDDHHTAGRGGNSVGSTNSASTPRNSPTKPTLNPKARPFSPVTGSKTSARIVDPPAKKTGTGVTRTIKHTHANPPKQEDATSFAVERLNNILSSDTLLREMLMKKGHKVYDFYDVDEDLTEPGHVESGRSDMTNNMEKTMAHVAEKIQKAELDSKKEVVSNRRDAEAAITPTSSATVQEGVNNDGVKDDMKRHEEHHSQSEPGPSHTPTGPKKAIEKLINFDEDVVVDSSSKVQQQSGHTAFVSYPVSSKPQQPTQATRKILDPLIWSQFEKFQLSITAKKPEAEKDAADTSASVAVGSCDPQADDAKRDPPHLSVGRDVREPDSRSSRGTRTTTETRPRQAEKPRSAGSAPGSASGSEKGERMETRLASRRARNPPSLPQKGQSRHNKRPSRVELPPNDIDTTVWRSARAKSPPTKVMPPRGFW